MSRGTTLIELATVLLLMGLGGAVLLPVGSRIRNRIAVASARESVAGLFAEARSAAVLHGGSSVHLTDRPWRAWYEVSGIRRRSVHLEKDHSVSVIVDRGGSPYEVRFDALGLGRAASSTLRFRRGAAEAGLTLSSYGRVRRW